MEEKDVQVKEESLPPNAQTEENKCKCSKKISGDLRTFIISLLTALIVVLAYHGTLMAIRCAKKDCRPQKKICVMQIKSCPLRNVPQRMERGNFHHHQPMRRKMVKCPNCAKEEFHSRKFRKGREFKKMSPEAGKSVEEKKTEQQK